MTISLILKTTNTRSPVIVGPNTVVNGWTE